MGRYANVQETMDSYIHRFNAEKAEGLDITVQVNISGDDGGDWFMVIKNQEMDLQVGEADNPDLSVKASDKNWLKFNNGEGNPMTMMMMGQLKLKGPIPLAMKFPELFSGKKK